MEFGSKINRVAIRTSPNTWTELRVLYESGEYSCLATFFEQVKDKFEDMPNLYQLKDRCRDEGWDKERFQEVRIEVKRRNLIELYARLGMDEIEQAKYRISCVKAVDDIKDVIDKLYQSLTCIDENSREYTETLSKIKLLTDTMLKGMGTCLAALQDISKLTGEYAPVSTKDVKGHAYRTKDGIKEIEDMSEEEILQDLKRMQRAGIKLDEIEELKTASDEQRGPNEP